MPDSLIADGVAPCSQYLHNHSQTKWETEAHPDSGRNEFSGIGCVNPPLGRQIDGPGLSHRHDD